MYPELRCPNRRTHTMGLSDVLEYGNKQYQPRIRRIHAEGGTCSILCKGIASDGYMQKSVPVRVLPRSRDSLFRARVPCRVEHTRQAGKRRWLAPGEPASSLLRTGPSPKVCSRRACIMCRPPLPRPSAWPSWLALLSRETGIQTFESHLWNEKKSRKKKQFFCL